MDWAAICVLFSMFALLSYQHVKTLRRVNKLEHRSDRMYSVLRKMLVSAKNPKKEISNGN